MESGKLLDVFKKVTVGLTVLLLVASLVGIVWSCTLPNFGMALMFLAFASLAGFFVYRDFLSK